MNEAATSSTAIAERRPAGKMTIFKQQVKASLGEFVAALPSHMPAERFVRVLVTAVQTNPELLEAERRSLFSSALKCAQDGLLPDGREAALVIFKDFRRGKIVQYQPMVAGIRKKVRNSGEIADWNAHVVYAKDEFEYERGDDPFIKHKDYLPKPIERLPDESEADFAKRSAAHFDRGPIIAAYSIAILKGGEKSREVMSIGDIEAIRERSTAWKAFVAGHIKTTPWQTDRGEMCKKTVVKRHSKVLPMSTDLDDLLRRDDNLYQHDQAAHEAREIVNRSLSDKLNMLAGDESEPLPDHDAETGEIIEGDTGAIDIKQAANEAATEATAKVTKASEAKKAAAELSTKQVSAASQAETPAAAQAVTSAEAGNSPPTNATASALTPELIAEADAAAERGSNALHALVVRLRVKGGAANVLGEERFAALRAMAKAVDAEIAKEMETK